MLKRLDLGETAPWRQRFRAPSILWAQVANLNPQRGVVCTDRDGVFQLYAWDLKTGELQQRTEQPAGLISGLLAADGEHIYYHQDEGGNEIGHFVRVPYAGGLAEDLTPELPPYGSFEIMQSYQGTVLGMRTASPDGFSLYVWTLGEAPRLIHQSQALFHGPMLSHNGEIAVIASTEGTGSLDRRLVAFDVSTGKQIVELWEGEGVGHDPGDFAPLLGDFRILSTTSRSGYNRPVIWNARTGERRDLTLPGVLGNVEPWRWSRDGKRVLLSQLHQARRQLYLYDLESDTVTQLQHPAGLTGSFRDNGVMTPEGEILITWQDPAHPARLVALDGRNGRKLRTVLAAGEVPVGRSWRSITFKSENGAAIHGWLAVPEGKGPFPPSSTLTVVPPRS